MKTELSTLRLTGSHVGGCNPLPFFRARCHQKPLADAGLLPQEREGFGYETAFRVLPYQMQDSYARATSEITLKTVILENEHLKATFLCEYGGRLYSLYDKTAERELLYVNPIFQPANLAIRNAWFSGGIEWNIGQFGHTFLTCESLFFARCRDENGAEFLRVYEYERCKGAFLQIDFHLPSGARQLFAHVSILNSRDHDVPMYWWTNIAVEENRDVRIMSGSDQVIYIRPETLAGQGDVHAFAHGQMPFLETIGGLDASQPDNLPYSCEYFFQNPADPARTWEAAVYNDGTAFWERSTPKLRYRKMFCWGNRRGGGHWQEFLTRKGTPKYLEIQGGVSPSQVHGCDIGAGERWSFTQAFGGLTADTARAFGEWNAARDYVYEVADKQLSAAELLRLDEQFARLRDTPPEALLHTGSGWGVLEALRQPDIIPAGLLFPAETLGAAQQPWRELLETDNMPQNDLPPSWMIDPRWMRLVERALEQDENNPQLLLHYGVMLYENDRSDEGIAVLFHAFKARPTAICAMCLAQAMQQTGQIEDACRFIEQAIELGGLVQSSAFAEVFIKLQSAAGSHQRAWEFFGTLPPAAQEEDRILLEVAPSAFELEEWAFLERLFARDFTLLREGENTLTELWFKKQAVELARQRGVSDYRTLLAEVRATLDPPYNIDFHMGPPLKKPE